MSINHNSLDNKCSWRILKDFYCSVTTLKELGLILTKLCMITSLSSVVVLSVSVLLIKDDL